MPAACSVMFSWQSCHSSSSTPLASSLHSFARCRFTLGFHRINGKPLRVNTKPFTNDSGGRFALARSRLWSRPGAARTTITASDLRTHQRQQVTAVVNGVVIRVIAPDEQGGHAD